MEDGRSREREAALTSRLLAEVVDLSAMALTTLDLQVKILAKLEARPEDEVVEEVSEQLKARRREVLSELDAWTDSVFGADGKLPPSHS